MNSGTWTEAGAPPPHRSRPSLGTGSFRPWHFFVLASLIAATAAVWVVRPGGVAALGLLSLAIGAAGLAAFGLYRTVWPLVAREFSDGIATVGPRTRAALEREKTLVLRSIKELEFDRAMGKVSEADFQEMVARLRARALTLLRQLDQGGSPYRTLIERELQARLAARLATTTSGEGASGSRDELASVRPSRDVSVLAAEAGEGRSCAACGTMNDPDARFCKQCGARLADRS